MLEFLVDWPVESRTKAQRRWEKQHHLPCLPHCGGHVWLCDVAVVLESSCSTVRRAGLPVHPHAETGAGMESCCVFWEDLLKP